MNQILLLIVFFLYKRIFLTENLSFCYRTEEEIGLDNLKEVKVPSEYTEKFHKMDKDFISNT